MRGHARPRVIGWAPQAAPCRQIDVVDVARERVQWQRRTDQLPTTPFTARVHRPPWTSPPFLRPTAAVLLAPTPVDALCTPTSLQSTSLCAGGCAFTLWVATLTVCETTSEECKVACRNRGGLPPHRAQPPRPIGVAHAQQKASDPPRRHRVVRKMLTLTQPELD